MDRLNAKTINRIVGKNVKPDTNIMTDEHGGYVGLHGKYKHHSVCHSKEEYVRNFFCHINSFEGAWSLFKRQVNGTHHWVSKKHLQRYLDEMCYRFNRRDMDEGFRVNDLLDRADGRLPYKALIA